MATVAEQRRAIRGLIDDFEPQVRDAFLESVQAIADRVVLGRVIEALEAGNVEAAIDALNIDRIAFEPLLAALYNAYRTGGATTIAMFPPIHGLLGNVIAVRWDARNLRAEQWLSELSSENIRGVVEETKAGVRAVITEGYTKGQGPRQIATDIAGRVNRVTGKREGGLVGLSEPQAKAVNSLRSRLASGDPVEMRKVLDMKTRDRRFDRTIEKAIREGKPVAAVMIEKAASRYADKAKKLRADTIARTETGEAVMVSKYEATLQALEASGRTEADLTKVWRSAGDNRVRDTHRGLNGQKVRGLSRPFVSSSGARMRWPMDRGLGAGAAETIACRCDWDVVFDARRLTNGQPVIR